MAVMAVVIVAGFRKGASSLQLYIRQKHRQGMVPCGTLTIAAAQDQNNYG